jgi:DNA repair protein SbcC/Rad50
MIVNRLEVQGFKRYGNLVKFDFPVNCGTLAILGSNEVGKSSLFQSIEFAFYGLKQKEALNKEDIITWGKDKTKVEMEFTIGNQRYLLQRELRINGSSKVKLVPIVNGMADLNSTISTIREVDDKINDLLDNDSFRKLLYIRQKDLDALKDLYKTQREQSLNKVMGIDIFDDATKLARSDRAELHLQLETKESKMKDAIEPHRKSYEDKLIEKEKLTLEIAKLKETSSTLESKVKDLEAKLAIQDWKLKYKNAKKLEKSTGENLHQVMKQQSDCEQKSQTLSKYVQTIDKYTPEYERLTKLCSKFQSAETKLNLKKQDLQNLQSKKLVLAQKAGLSAKCSEVDELQLTNEKRIQLRKSIRLLI